MKRKSLLVVVALALFACQDAESSCDDGNATACFNLGVMLTIDRPADMRLSGMVQALAPSAARGACLP